MCMSFADDIVLVDETARVINVKLEIWEKYWSQRFRITRSKTECMECNFSTSQSASVDSDPTKSGFIKKRTF